MNDQETGEEPRKRNRRRQQKKERVRPVVHGALPYLGHRPDAMQERRRLAELVKNARKRGR